MNSWASEPPIIPTSELDGDGVEAEPLEDPAVGAVVRPYATSRPASSRSQLYESFITNSRTRMRPPRDRGSSRNFVWKWYTMNGSWR